MYSETTQIYTLSLHDALPIWQLVRQLLVESLLLSFFGGLAGMALAVIMTRGLIAFIPSENNPILVTPTPDLRIMSFTLDRKSTRLNSSHSQISYAVFCLKKKK